VSGTPWTRLDAIRTGAILAVGAVIWVVGWFRLADEPALADQIAPFNLVVVGFVLIGVGYANWFLAARRAIGRRQRALLAIGGAP
jgi:drug/metabolite transporter (DMT)-like permease